MRRRLLLGLMAATAVSALAIACSEPGDMFVVHDYNPRRDPHADLAKAVERAQAENKNILLIVGGEWCVWCHMLQDFIDQNNDVRDALAQAFVIVKVNYSDDNKNEAFLSQFPRSAGYPDFMVLNSAGEFQAQQPTDVLEQGRGYNRQRMLAFAERWRPGAART